MSEHQTCRETIAREGMRMRGRRSKAHAQDTYKSRSSTGWESGGALFKERAQNWPMRTLTWKLAVDAKFKSGGFQVPSFSSTFPGPNRDGGGEGSEKSPPAKLSAVSNIYRGLGCPPSLSLVYLG